jgi:hypothetical protein
MDTRRSFSVLAPGQTLLFRFVFAKHAILCLLADQLFHRSNRMNHATTSATVWNFPMVRNHKSQHSVEFDSIMACEVPEIWVFRAWLRCLMSGLLVLLLPRVFELVLSWKKSTFLADRAKSEGAANSQEFRRPAQSRNKPCLLELKPTLV